MFVNCFVAKNTTSTIPQNVPHLVDFLQASAPEVLGQSKVREILTAKWKDNPPTGAVLLNDRNSNSVGSLLSDLIVQYATVVIYGIRS